MLSDYIKKPLSDDYYQLHATNGKNYYFLSLETAKKVMDIKRNDTYSTEYILSHVRANERGELTSEIIDTIKKRETQSEATDRRKEMLRKNLSWLENSVSDPLIETLKNIAEEENRIPERRRI